ncbi:hypothetical protein Taro_035042 [Colocasia esculenta]|uniref:Co-chaperone protein p23 n=1 Tax=Colocasia esculenta TaxID=4460 RepID=A0A843W4L8_COLES|nr:hypothetical protein [Colocasia esculenta]
MVHAPTVAQRDVKREPGNCVVAAELRLEEVATVAMGGLEGFIGSRTRGPQGAHLAHLGAIALMKVPLSCLAQGKMPDVKGSKTTIGLRNIICSIQKQNKGWWKRLLKSEGKPAPYIKVDWNKWCDEDEEETTCLAHPRFGPDRFDLFHLTLAVSIDAVDSEEDETGEHDDDGSSDEDGLLYVANNA